MGTIVNQFLNGITWKQFKKGFTTDVGDGGLDKVTIENKIRTVFSDLATDYDFTDFWDTFNINTKDLNYQYFINSYDNDDINDVVRQHAINLFNAYKMYKDLASETMGTVHNLNKAGSTTVSNQTSTNGWTEGTQWAEDDNDKKRLSLYNRLLAEFTNLQQDLKEYLNIFISWKGDYTTEN